MPAGYLAGAGPRRPYIMPDLKPFFRRFDRKSWANFPAPAPPSLTEQEAYGLRGQTTQVTLAEVETVYRPLARLLSLHILASWQLHRATQEVLVPALPKVPFVVGIAGSVAAGKSTATRVLRALLERLPGALRVEIVTTDGFLWPTARLEAEGLMHRKGFPESYDQAGMVAALAAIKGGERGVRVPVYSHYHYDIVPDRAQTLGSPDVVLVEGLNVLQAPQPGQHGPFVRDFLDFSIYVDAEAEQLRAWYLERFMLFRAQAQGDPGAFFHRFCGLSEQDARHFAEQVWCEINARNLAEHVLPYRQCARLILHKRADHQVDSVFLRRS